VSRHASGFLLLTTGQFLQLLDQLVDLAIAALLLGALLHLVLIRQLVHLELEQVGEVVGERALLAAAATAAALLLRDLQLVLLLGVLQQLQRALLRRQRGIGLHRLEVGLGRLHFLRRLGQRLGDLVVGGIDRAEARLQLADELFDLIAQLRLREVEEHHVLAVLLRLGLRLVADDVERRGDDLALLLRELADLLPAAAPAAAARLRLRRLVVLLERPDLHEVDVARRRLRPLDRVGVGRLRVVRHEVARLEPELLEVDGVAGADLGERLRSAEQVDRLRRAAVDRVEQLQRLHAVVVVRPRFEEQLLDPEDGRFEFAGLSGTSAGGMNAAAMVQGLIQGGEKGAIQSLEDFWRSLEMRARVRDVDASSLERSTQLTQKTNQFNLTLVRRTLDEVRRLVDDPSAICKTLEI